MPFGDLESKIPTSNFKDFIRKFYIKFFGAGDLHHYIRWRKIKSFIDFSSKSTLDVGCGYGHFMFEIYKKKLKTREKDFEIKGIDFPENDENNDNEIKINRYIVERIIDTMGLKNNIKIARVDLELEDNFPITKIYHQILLLDVLEHLNNREALLFNIAKIMDTDSILVISVPTPNYIKFFGGKNIVFNKIGHKVDGFWLDDLSLIMKKHGLKIVRYEYYTYILDNLFCYIYYKFIRFNDNDYIKGLFTQIFRFFTIFDWFIYKPSSLVCLVKKEK